MATKKYSNNIDNDIRHHYDVYEVHGEVAYHVAPFAQEYQAQRVADALAALDDAERNYPYVRRETLTKYVVRARPSGAHKIYETDAQKIHGEISRFHTLTETLAAFSQEALEDIKLPTEAPEGFALPEKKNPIKTKKLMKKKDKSAA